MARRGMDGWHSCRLDGARRIATETWIQGGVTVKPPTGLAFLGLQGAVVVCFSTPWDASGGT